MVRAFQLVSPTSVAEASRELARLGEAAKLYAGGSELFLLMKQGLVQCEYLVNVKGIAELGALRWNGTVAHIGGAVTHRQLERSQEVAQRLPLLWEAESRVANVRVRSVGTIGGNLAFGDPHSDTTTALLAHDARVKIGSGDGQRVVNLEDFFLGLYETALAPHEVLEELEVPALPAGMGWAYLRAARFERPSLAVAVAASVRAGRLEQVRLAVGCVGPTPVRLRGLEGRVAQAPVGEAQRLLLASRDHLREALEPVEDLHGSAEYKTYLAATLLSRALGRAAGADGGR